MKKVFAIGLIMILCSYFCACQSTDIPQSTIPTTSNSVDYSQSVLINCLTASGDVNDIELLEIIHNYSDYRTTKITDVADMKFLENYTHDYSYFTVETDTSPEFYHIGIIHIEISGHNYILYIEKSGNIVLYEIMGEKQSDGHTVHIFKADNKNKLTEERLIKLLSKYTFILDNQEEN